MQRLVPMLISVLALAAVGPAPAAAQNLGGVPAPFPLQSVTLAPIGAPPVYEILELGSRYLTPQNVEPYGTIDQNNVRQSNYNDPMHCSMAGLLTPGQMEAAQTACLERFYHVDHSG